MNLSDTDRDFGTEDKCLAFLEMLRWPDGVECVKCQSKSISRVTAITRGRSKHTKGKTWTRHLYECLNEKCREQFSVKSGTLFHDSHLPMKTWFKAIVLVCQSKKGQSANQVGRTIGVSYKTAWYLCHRIREAMQNGGDLLTGTVEIDETYVGGKKIGKGVYVGKHSKDVVIGMKQRGGELRLFHTPDAKARTVRELVKRHISRDVEMVATDEAAIYPVALDGICASKHETVRHSAGEYVRGDVHTNGIESSFSLFKRGLVGSFHRLSYKHLNRYVREFEWRYNNRRNPEMFANVLRNSAKRGPLTFRALISA